MRSQAERQIFGYIRGKVGISLLVALVHAGVLRLVGLDLWLVFGVLAFLLNFIPNVGSIVAVLLPLPVLLVSPDISTLTAILALALPGAVQFTMGNLVEPRFIGQSLDLHPITVLMALIFWGMLWGFLGMVLSVPMAAVMKLLFERLSYTRPLAEMMAGRMPASA